MKPVVFKLVPVSAKVSEVLAGSKVEVRSWPGLLAELNGRYIIQQDRLMAEAVWGDQRMPSGTRAPFQQFDPMVRGIVQTDDKIWAEVDRLFGNDDHEGMVYNEYTQRWVWL